MGKIASKYSDFIVLTSDNPRSEDALDIIRQIEWGVSIKDVKCIVDRPEAVRFALAEMEEGDTLVLAGKGNENYLEIKGKKYRTAISIWWRGTQDNERPRKNTFVLRCVGCAVLARCAARDKNHAQAQSKANRAGLRKATRA